MTRHLITTGYGADALARLREVVSEAKRTDPLAPVTVLVPNNLAGIVARRDLAHGLIGDRPGIAGLRITTIPRLAEELAAVPLSPRRPQTRTITAAAWRVALDTEPGVFAEVAEHSATIEALVRAHRELRDVDAAALETIAASGPVAADLVRLHRRVVAALAADWYDETDLLHRAIGLAHRVRGAVVLHLPQVLSRAERHLVDELDAHADLTVLLGLTGEPRADRDVLERFGEPAERASDVPAPTAHHVVSSSDSDDEVRCVGRAVLADLEAGVPANRIAVLYAAANPYARLLHERFAAMGVTTNGPGVRAVVERAAARLLLGLLDVADAPEGEDLPRAELFRALSAASVVDFAGAPLPLSRWERISRDAGIVRGDDWDQRLARLMADTDTAIADEQQQDDPRQSRIDAITRRRAGAAQLRDFALELRALLQRGTRLTSWRDLADWALDLLQTLLPEASMKRMPPEEQAAAAAVIGTLGSLGALDDLEQHASLRTLRDVLRIELDTTPPRVGTFGLGVLVAPISAAIGLDLDRVHVVGLAEDLYPGRVAEDALLPDAVRARSEGQLPRLRRRLDDRHRHLLAAMQSAPSVTVSVPRGDLRRSTRRLPSRWLLPTLRALSGEPGLAMTDWDRDLRRYGDAVSVSGSFAGELLGTDRLADAQEWRTRAVAAGERVEDAVIAGATAMVEARASDRFTPFDGNLAGVAGLPDLLTADAAIAPTRLESYATCPHAYFVQRMLRVEPLEEPAELLTISALDVGNFLHRSLDLLAKQASLPAAGAAWTAAQRAALQQIAIAQAEAYEERGVTGHPRLWAVEREQLLNDLVRILDDDDAVRLERGATVLASELEFGDGRNPPVEIVVPGGRVRMKGSADRVDRRADGTLVVIDMKTGGDSSYKDIARTEDRLVRGTKLQLPVYAHAARQRYGQAEVRAEYWFVRREMHRIELPLDEVEERYADTVGLLARSMRDGVFPQRPPETADFLWTRCRYCNPDRIGHGDARERWERKRHDPALAEYVGLVEPEALADEEGD